MRSESATWDLRPATLGPGTWDLGHGPGTGRTLGHGGDMGFGTGDMGTRDLRPGTWDMDLGRGGHWDLGRAGGGGTCDLGRGGHWTWGGLEEAGPVTWDGGHWDLGRGVVACEAFTADYGRAGARPSQAIATVFSLAARFPRPPSPGLDVHCRKPLVSGSWSLVPRFQVSGPWSKWPTDDSGTRGHACIQIILPNNNLHLKNHTKSQEMFPLVRWRNYCLNNDYILTIADAVIASKLRQRAHFGQPIVLFLPLN